MQQPSNQRHIVIILGDLLDKCIRFNDSQKVTCRSHVTEHIWVKVIDDGCLSID